MPFLGSALGLTAMCSLGWGNLVAFDWNDLAVGREFDCKFLKKVSSVILVEVHKTYINSMSSDTNLRNRSNIFYFSG